MLHVHVHVQLYSTVHVLNVVHVHAVHVRTRTWKRISYELVGFNKTAGLRENLEDPENSINSELC